jgi:adenosylcobyric acid synthase
MSLFDEGRTMLERLSGAPCLGVFPHAGGITVHAEDSLALDREPATPSPAGASVAILQFPRLSNGTDFRLLTWADWIASPVDRGYDFVILPGSKDTLSDLAWLRERGLDAWVRAQHQRGATVLGICGGFQMLGETITDPDGADSGVRGAGAARGLGLIAADTVMLKEKTTRVRRATIAGGATCDAYEIHMGRTTMRTPCAPFATLEDGSADGAVGTRVIGTYLHGVLEDAAVCSTLFNTHVPTTAGSAARYDALADWFDVHAERPGDWLPGAG